MLYDAKRWDRPKIEPLAEWQRVLLQAADLIEHCGHTKHAMHDERGYCASGAIAAVVAKGAWLDGISVKFMQWTEAVGKLTTYVGAYVPTWNNAPERTAEEVIAALRRAAL